MVEYNGLSYKDDSFTVCTGLIDDKLKHVKLHENTKEIYVSAFHNTNIEKVICNEGLETIAKYAFCNCNLLKAINFPSSLKLIDESAFECSAIENVDLSKCKKLKLGKFSFFDAGIKVLILPDTLKEIPMKCFCFNLFKTIDLPTFLEVIGQEAFYNCRKLESVDFKNVKIISEGAFIGNTKLKEVFFNEVEEIQNSAFESCNQLKEINLSNTKIKSLQKDTFSGCYNLEKLILPNTIEVLKDNSLLDTKVTEITIPTSVIRIEELNSRPVKCFYDDINHIEVVGKKIKLIQISLEELLNRNKSFKEANDILNKLER